MKSAPCKSFAIVGRAVATPVKSSAEEKSEMQRDTRTSQNLMPLSGFFDEGLGLFWTGVALPESSALDITEMLKS